MLTGSTFAALTGNMTDISDLVTGGVALITLILSSYILVLNHFIILYNVFEYKALTNMLVFKLQDYLDYVKPFLILINYWPDRIEGGFETPIIGTDVSMDMELVEKLRKI